MYDQPLPHRPEPTRGVFAIIYGETDTVLLSEYRDHLHWNLPGGGVNEGETDEEALIREVLDETGLLVEVDERLGGDLVRGDDTAALYVCRVVGGLLEPTRESRRHMYANRSEIGCLKIIGGKEGRMFQMVLLGFEHMYGPEEHDLLD